MYEGCHNLVAEGGARWWYTYIELCRSLVVVHTCTCSSDVLLFDLAENILVKENNVIKIADFGLAIAVSDIPLDVERSFHPAGTDCYMPPEV